MGREDRAVLLALTLALLGGALLLALFPRSMAWTLAAILGWFGTVLAIRGLVQRARARQAARARSRGDTVQPPESAPSHHAPPPNAPSHTAPSHTGTATDREGPLTP